MNVTVQTNPGDIVLVHTPSFVANSIRWILRLFQSDPVRFSHCLLVLNGDECIEAGIHVQKCSLQKTLKKTRTAKIIRYVPAQDTVGLSRVIDLAVKRLGEHYGYFRLGMHLLNQITGLKCFTNVFSECDVVKTVCSSLVAEGYDKVYGVKFNNVDWQSVEPDDIDDHSQNPNSGWIMVFDSRIRR